MLKVRILKKLAQPIWRYGNPDVHFLGTLKFEYQILKDFSFLIRNLRSFFKFRVAIYTISDKT